MNLKKIFAIVVSLILSGLSVFGGIAIAEDVTASADVSNVAPTVKLLEHPSSVSLIESELNNTFQVKVQVNDDNGIGDLNLTDGVVKSAIKNTTAPQGEGITEEGNAHVPLEVMVSNSTINDTAANYTVEVQEIPYYRGPYPSTIGGDVFVYINQLGFVDESGAYDIVVFNQTINTLVASDVNVTSVDFGSIAPGSSGTTGSFKVENTGNVELNSSWKGTDFTGPDTISVTNSRIYSDTYGDMTLTNTAQLYASFLPTQTDAGEPNRYYEPKNFNLNVPLGTLAGTYTNTYTHSAVEA